MVLFVLARMLFVLGGGAVLLLLSIAIAFKVFRSVSRLVGGGGRHGGTIGFFHPYANSGGGGERVLWACVRAILEEHPGRRVVIYSGDGVSSNDLISRALQRFDISLPVGSSVEIVNLRLRWLVEASTWPVATLVGQSVGSMVLAWEALLSLYPDVFIDSMGYAFTYPIVRLLGPARIACYTHYPTISSDMLARVRERRPDYNNVGAIAQSAVASRAKLLYYRAFAWCYGLVGRTFPEVAIANSSWTAGHLSELWGVKIATVFPPCNTEARQHLPLIPKGAKARARSVISIAQFRPEKDHPLQLRAFKQLLALAHEPHEFADVRLVLIGSSRNAEDEERIASLRTLAVDLGIASQVDFVVNASFDVLNGHLASGLVGIHTMWQEHFGIAIVEAMAAGQIMVAHNSGGPKADIVVPHLGQRTGFLATTEFQYAQALATILRLAPAEVEAIQKAARSSVTQRFSDSAFNVAIKNALQKIL